MFNNVKGFNKSKTKTSIVHVVFFISGKFLKLNVCIVIATFSYYLMLSFHHSLHSIDGILLTCKTSIGTNPKLMEQCQEKDDDNDDNDDDDHSK